MNEHHEPEAPPEEEILKKTEDWFRLQMLLQTRSKCVKKLSWIISLQWAIAIFVAWLYMPLIPLWGHILWFIIGGFFSGSFWSEVTHHGTRLNEPIDRPVMWMAVASCLAAWLLGPFMIGFGVWRTFRRQKEAGRPWYTWLCPGYLQEPKQA